MKRKLIWMSRYKQKDSNCSMKWFEVNHKLGPNWFQQHISCTVQYISKCQYRTFWSFNHKCYCGISQERIQLVQIYFEALQQWNTKTMTGTIFLFRFATWLKVLSFRDTLINTHSANITLYLVIHNSTKRGAASKKF